MPNALYKKAMDLPQKPGVYQMLDKNGETLYVGKAKSLRNRVSSYFSGRLDDKTTVMVSKVVDFSVIICANEFEALMLEYSLVREKNPRYNIRLKDDKGYPSIRLDTKVPYPRFTMVGKRAEDDAKYFGPYGSRPVTRNVIRTVSHALGLPTCSRKFPRDIGKERPCLNYHMGQCPAYCLKDTPKSDYDKAIAQAIMVLDGKSAELTKTLQKEMEQAAADMHFERAANLRDRIRALESLETQQQNVVSPSIADTDVLGYYRGAAKSAFAVLHYVNGKLLDKDYEILDNPLEDTAEAISAIVKQYYLRREQVPRTIYLPCKIEDLEPIEALLTERTGTNVTIHVPQRGDKRQMVETACDNAKVEAERASSGEERVRGILQWLQKALGLESPPMRIEAYDISNLGSSDIVAAMTVFQNARPLKRDYRKFRIKSLAVQDDYHSMEEVLTRRFNRYVGRDALGAPSISTTPHLSDAPPVPDAQQDSFDNLPDLVLIDGGATHAKVATKVVQDLGLNIPIFGMVKDAKHKTRALITEDGKEISMGAVPQVFAFIATIQEETHRFAITYQRSLRTKHIGSSLDDIPGVGETRRNALLKAFKTIKNIQSATEEELAAVVPKSTAKAIRAHFTADNGENETCESSQEQQEAED